MGEGIRGEGPTNDGKEHRKEDETVKAADDDNSKKHAKVENLENLGVCEGENNDTPEFREGDSTQHGAANVRQRFVGSFDSSSLV